MQVVGDGLGLAAAYYSSFYLRFNMAPAERYLDMAEQTLPVVVLATLAALMTLRVYRVMWRYLSLADLVRLSQAVFFGMLLATVALALWTRLIQYPRTVLPIYGVLAVVLLSSIRMIGRSWFERGMRLRVSQEDMTRVLLIGAGRAAEILLSELRGNRDSNLQVVGLLDDDPVKQGRFILGAPVLGGIDSLTLHLEAEEVERVVFCIPSAPNSLRLKLLELCSDYGARLETVPRIADLAEGKITVNQIREVTLSDLLGRDPVALDEGAVASFLNAKVVMITGAGGSIGSEICRQVMRYGPAMVLLFERSELALFQIDGELRRRFSGANLVPLLGDIQDPQRVEEVLEQYKPQVVFHAAAYKHVPLVEMNPFQALANNVGGSQVVAQASAAAKVDRFVLISTDKAVNPTSFMGATKRIAERVCQAVGGQAEHTRFTTVRFGNVIGSSGSVIPTFREQIRRGGPITVTHEKIERFFMTIPEAAQLVLQASTLSDGDETFILDMGQPVRIVDLARQMIRLSGLKEGEDIEIQFTGLRPGEKLYEELMIDGEDHTRTAHKKIMRVSRKQQDHQAVLDQTSGLLEAGAQRQTQAIRKLASDLVDNYQPTHLPEPVNRS
jgi:FlaA1/EpsC-like NDP-sugar epimerase